MMRFDLRGWAGAVVHPSTYSIVIYYGSDRASYHMGHCLYRNACFPNGIKDFLEWKCDLESRFDSEDK